MRMYICVGMHVQVEHIVCVPHKHTHIYIYMYIYPAIPEGALSKDLVVRTPIRGTRVLLTGSRGFDVLDISAKP